MLLSQRRAERFLNFTLHAVSGIVKGGTGPRDPASSADRASSPHRAHRGFPPVWKVPMLWFVEQASERCNVEPERHRQVHECFGCGRCLRLQSRGSRAWRTRRPSSKCMRPSGPGVAVGRPISRPIRSWRRTGSRQLSISWHLLSRQRKKAGPKGGSRELDWQELIPVESTRQPADAQAAGTPTQGIERLRDFWRLCGETVAKAG